MSDLRYVNMMVDVQICPELFSEYAPLRRVHMQTWR